MAGKAEMAYRSPYNLRSSTGVTLPLAGDSPDVDVAAVESFLNDVSPLTIVGASRLSQSVARTLPGARSHPPARHAALWPFLSPAPQARSPRMT